MPSLAWYGTSSTPEPTADGVQPAPPYTPPTHAPAPGATPDRYGCTCGKTCFGGQDVRDDHIAYWTSRPAPVGVCRVCRAPLTFLVETPDGDVHVCASVAHPYDPVDLGHRSASRVLVPHGSYRGNTRWL